MDYFSLRDLKEKLEQQNAKLASMEKLYGAKIASLEKRISAMEKAPAASVATAKRELETIKRDALNELKAKGAMRMTRTEAEAAYSKIVDPWEKELFRKDHALELGLSK